MIRHTERQRRRKRHAADMSRCAASAARMQTAAFQDILQRSCHAAFCFCAVDIFRWLTLF